MTKIVLKKAKEDMKRHTRRPKTIYKERGKRQKGYVNSTMTVKGQK